MTIEITLPSPMNQSCQVGDIAHYVKTTEVSIFDVNNSQIVMIGEIAGITDNGTNVVITCLLADVAVPPVPGDFIFFSKDRRVNETSLLGYFGEFKFENNSRKKAELFMAGCEVTPNS